MSDQSICEVCRLAGDPPFVSWWQGPLTSRQLESIEKDFAENTEMHEEWFTHGDGLYKFTVHWVEPQIEKCGGVDRVTDPGYWEVSFVSYEEFPEEKLTFGDVWW